VRGGPGRADRISVLRSAFQATLGDPAFLADAQRAGLDVEPVSGEEIERLVERLFTLRTGLFE
jgi:hypothetical protein